MSTIPIDDKLMIGPDRANIDARYKASNNRPYTSVAAAEAAINLVIGNVGLTVLVADENDPDYPKAKEYWVQPYDNNGVTAYHLVEKHAGVTDYEDLEKLPKINNVELKGSKTASNLGLATAEQGDKADTAIQGVSVNGTEVTPDPTTKKVALTIENGKSAYEVYVDNYKSEHEGSAEGVMTESEWLESLKGEKGDSGHNPCLGRLNTLPADLDAAFPNAIAGDYIYVDSVDNTTTPPTTTTTVYHYVDSTNGWDSGTAIEVNDATFTSGQSVSTLPIKDLDGQSDPTAQGVLSAEAGQAIVERLSIIPSEEQDINLKPDVVWLDGYNSIDTNGNVVPRESLYRTSEYITLPSNSSTINYKGGTASTSSIKQVAVYNDSDECLGTFFQYPVSDGGNVFDISNLAGATKIRISEYSQRVSGDTWDISVVALITKTNQEVFNNFSQSVDNRFDGVNEGLDDIDEKLNNADEEYYLSDPVDKGTNLKNDVVWLEGFYYLGADGRLVPDASIGRVSDYISLPTNTKSIIYKGGIDTNDNHKQVAIYDKNDNCLAVFRETPVASEGNVYDITNYPTAIKMRIGEWQTYVNNNNWDISVIHSVRQTNKETFSELLDWIDSLNQWKGKKFIAFGASNTQGGSTDGTAFIQIASEKLKMMPPIVTTASRRVSLKYENDALALVGLAATVAECQSISASTTISYETQFAKDFDCVLFGGFAGESYDESQVVIDNTTYYGGEELIDLVRLPTTRYNNNPHFTYSNGDTLAEHRDSYIGAIIYLLNELWTLKPTCRVVFCNAFAQWNNYSYWERNRIGVSKLCQKLKIPFLDLSDCLYFNGFTTGNGTDEDKINPNIFLHDGQHASLAGRHRLANVFAHRLLLLS